MRKLAFVLALGTLAWSAFVVPLPLLTLAPLPAQPVTEVMKISGPTDPITGKLLFTAVSVQPATPVTALAAWPDPYRDVVLEQSVIPQNIDHEEFTQIQQRIFAESLRVAAAVGMRQVGLPVHVSGDGARVVRVLPGAPARGELQTGDIIVAANGRPIRLASQLAAETTELDVGDELQLTVLRGDEHLDVGVAVRLIPEASQVGLGILVTTLNQQIQLPVPIDLAPSVNVGGASAGLMLAVAVYDLLHPADLTGKRVIAGTGTIDLTGAVGPVGGITEKVRGAQLAGATIFLAPEQQVEQARGVASPGLTVIGVGSIRDTIEALQVP